MKLMTEQINDSKLVIEESADGVKDFYIEGIFMQSGIKNRNGRIYPKEVMQKQLSQYNENFVNSGRALGELGHPASPSVNLERVSHNIVKLEYSGDNNVVGKAKLLDTPYGNIAKSLVKDGVQLGVSSRGLGSIKESNGASVVQGDFYLAAVDIVADPSAPDAFVNGIMENCEWVYENGILTQQQIESVQQEVDEAARKGRTDDEVLSIFENILQNL
jgi:hypothetical protein